MIIRDGNYLQHMDSIKLLLETRTTNVISIHTNDTWLDLQLSGLSELIVIVKTCTVSYIKRLLEFLIPVCKMHYIRTICIRTSLDEIQTYCMDHQFHINPLKRIKLSHETLADFNLVLNDQQEIKPVH